MIYFLVFIGTLLLGMFIQLLFYPSYDKLKQQEKKEFKDVFDYNNKCYIVSFFFSLMLNCLAWGLML